MSIHQKALADVTWSDLEALIRDGVQEGPTLDYKKTLSHPDGEDPWIRGQGKIGRPAREEMAIAIVAFANAYGGTVLLGVDEGAGNTGIPAELVPLPRAADLAERLHRAISDVVDPPLPGFATHAILAPGAEGTGVIALRVPASDAAPHGTGSPPACYVRRGASATPMTMRDIQSVFWDARTRRERVEEIRARHSSKLRVMQDLLQLGQLKDRDGTRLEKQTQGLLVRVTAIPQLGLEIDPLPYDEWQAGLRPTGNGFGVQASSAFGEGRFGSSWARTAHGIWCDEGGPGHWSIRDDGCISIVGFRRSIAGLPGATALNFHPPSRFAVLCGQVMVMADRVRRYAGRPDVPIEIDCEFLNDGTAIGGGEEAYRWGDRDMRPMLPTVSIGPFLLTSRAEFPNIYWRIEREIWNAFGAQNVEAIKLDFQRAFGQS